MPYVINRWDGSPIVTVEDGTVTQTIDVKLIGKNYAGYGEIQNENFIHLLENFAGAQSPVNAISGQLWFDSINKKLKFYTGDQIAGVKIWKSAGGVEYGTEPPNSAQGDLWFDISSNQLKLRQSTGWLIIGPQTAGSGVTQMRSRTIQGWPLGVENAETNMQPLTYPIIAAMIDDEVVCIVSDNEFTIRVDQTDATSNIAGFNTGATRNIKKGLNLPYTDDNGKSSSSHVYWGTAALSKGVVRTDGQVVLADQLISDVNVDFTNSQVSILFPDVGIKVGNDQDLHVFIEQGVTPVIRNLTGNTISFRVNDGTNTPAAIDMIDKAILPSVTEAYTLGNATKKWSNVFATTFTGQATSAASLTYSPAPNSNLVASESDTAWTVPIRDANKTITSTLFYGDALRARYADLAEKYLTDAEYDTGTVVTVGGDAEVTASKIGDRALGVISANPAYMMNSDLEGGQYVALKGRVPVKVTGPVKKGSKLVAGDNGTAYAFDHGNDYFAIALEEDLTETSEPRLIESIIL
jgi:hypothetical protein